MSNIILCGRVSTRSGLLSRSLIRKQVVKLFELLFQWTIEPYRRMCDVRVGEYTGEDDIIRIEDDFARML